MKFLLGLMCLVVFGTSKAEEIKVAGGAAPLNNVFKPIAKPFKDKTGIDLNLTEGGPDLAWKDLIYNKIDVASAGVAFNDWLELMKKKNIEVKDPDQYKQTTVGRDKIKVLVHKDLKSIKALDSKQLKGLFTGKIKNWKEVGGPDLAVKVVFGEKIPGTNKYWQDRVLDKEEFSKDVLVGTMGEIIESVTKTPGAIAIGALSGAKDGDIYSVEDIPDISRPIVMLTKGEPNANVKKLIDFIRSEGSKYIVR